MSSRDRTPHSESSEPEGKGYPTPYQKFSPTLSTSISVKDMQSSLQENEFLSECQVSHIMGIEIGLAAEDMAPIYSAKGQSIIFRLKKYIYI